jgi:biopolymer transport protein ExbB
MKRSHRIGLVVLLAGVLGGAALVFAQAPAPAPAPAGGAPTAAGPTAAPAAERKQWDTLWGMWVVGGPVMWPIGGCSVLAVGLAVYGFIAYRTDKMMRPDLVPQIQDSLERLNVDEAMNLCSGAPCLLTNVMGAGLRRISDGVLDVGSMEKAMEEAAVEETNEGMKPLNNLSVVAQVAPMLGLLGTVTGMIGAFNKIGLGAMGDPEKLANDIGEAMITTAFGLMVAIPAMFVYFYLKGRYLSNVSKLSRVIGDLVHHLVVSSRRAEGGAAPQPAAAPAGEKA